MKWDLKTVSSLYLVSIVQDRTIRSMRDLRKCHIGMLKDIRREAARIVSEKWGLGNGSLRIYVHYQPSYCKSREFTHIPYVFFTFFIMKIIDHFHVHIVNANYQASMMSMTVGQAHLLDDIVSLVSFVSQPNLQVGNNNHYGQLELDPDDGPGIYERMTLTYGLGDQHGLFESMKDSYTLI